MGDPDLIDKIRLPPLIKSIRLSAITILIHNVQIYLCNYLKAGN
jgi:hypothetical protein